MKVDSFGRVSIDEDEIINYLLKGQEIDGVFAPPEVVARHNELCVHFDKTDFLIPALGDLSETPENYHKARQDQWFFPMEYQQIDVYALLEGRCSSSEEIVRLRAEIDEFERRDAMMVLRLMVFLVDDFRKRKIVWGVGRGSSVASFALYLIGITKINPMKYGLEIGDFLKD